MRISKKILAIALSILMAVSMMPFTVFAEGAVFEFTNKKTGAVSELTSFPSAFNTDGTYKLLQDTTRTTRIVLGTFGSDVTIDLNGHTLTSTASDAFVLQQRNGSETSHKVFNIINTSSTPAVINSKMGVRIGSNTGAGKYTDFTLGENITLNVTDDAGFVLDVGSAGGTVVINGTVNSSESFGVTVNGNVKDETTAPTVIVNGKVTGEDAGIYAAGYANYVVNGVVEGATGIYQKGGNLTINDGATVTATGAKAAYVQNGNGMTATGDAIVVEDQASYNLGTTTINGGTITSTAAGTSAVAEYDANNAGTSAQEQEIVVSGGTFTANSAPQDVTAYLAEGAEQDPTTGEVTQYVATIGGTKYETFEAAWNAAVDGDTITLIADCAGNGLQAPQGKYTQGLTVDFAGHTYTIDGTLVGSTGTQSQAFQLLKDNTITFKNGTIYSEKARMLVQNYSNLTLDNMTLTLNNTTTAPATVYTLSNNNGDVVIKDTTINANPVNTAFAFDVCRYSSYPSVNVTVTGNSEINGDVEIYASKSDPKDGFSLTLESGELNGDIVIDATAENVLETTPAKAEITKASAFTQAAPEGYAWLDNGDNTYTLGRVAADEVSITTADKIEVNVYLDDTSAEKTVEYTFNGSPTLQQNNPKTETVDFASLPTVDGKKQLTIIVAPAQIRDYIDIDVKDETGAVIRSYDNYSVAAYCDEIIAGDYAANVQTLAKSVLDYGKAASAFFGYNETAFDNQTYNFNDFTFDTTGFTASATDITIDEVRYVATSVPSLRFVVDMAEAEAEDLTVTTDKGYAAKFIKVEDDVVLQVAGIPAAKLGETITITLKDQNKDVVGTIEYTPLVFAYMATKDTTTPGFARLGETIGQYATAANAVFA